MVKYLTLFPYNQECLELEVCLYDDKEPENYYFFTWTEQNIENIIKSIGEKVKEYKIEKVFFCQPNKVTENTKKNFSFLSSIVDFQIVSWKIIKEISSLVNKGIYSVANLEKKAGFWYVKEKRLLTQYQKSAYLILIYCLEKDYGKKLIQENETPQIVWKNKIYDRQPPITFTGKIVKCVERTVKKGKANEGSIFYSLQVEHSNSQYPQPFVATVFFGLLRDKTIWEKLVNQEVRGKFYNLYCWSGSKGFTLSYWEESNQHNSKIINNEDESNK